MTNKLEWYSGTRRFRDFYMVIAVSLLIISLTVGLFKLCISSMADISNYFCLQFSLLDFATFVGFVVSSPHRIPTPNNSTENVAPLYP